MKRLVFAALVLPVLLLQAGAAHADRHGRFDPDDRREMRRQMREHWQDSRREEYRDYRYREQRENATYWQQVPPDERRRMREEMREQRHEQHRYRQEVWR